MTEPIVFHKQDVEYRQWIKEHPDGLSVNIRNLMLHRTDCEHLGQLMTISPKACLNGPGAPSDLRAWGFRSDRGDLLLCEGCEA